jgi:hypothetical protein
MDVANQSILTFMKMQMDSGFCAGLHPTQPRNDDSRFAVQGNETTP